MGARASSACIRDPRAAGVPRFIRVFWCYFAELGRWPPPHSREWRLNWPGALVENVGKWRTACTTGCWRFEVSETLWTWNSAEVLIQFGDLSCFGEVPSSVFCCRTLRLLAVMRLEGLGGGMALADQEIIGWMIRASTCPWYVFDIWVFLEMGVPLVIIHFSRVSHSRPSSYWGSPLCGNPHITSHFYLGLLPDYSGTPIPYGSWKPPRSRRAGSMDEQRQGLSGASEFQASHGIAPKNTRFWMVLMNVLDHFGVEHDDPTNRFAVFSDNPT